MQHFQVKLQHIQDEENGVYLIAMDMCELTEYCRVLEVAKCDYMIELITQAIDQLKNTDQEKFAKRGILFFHPEKEEEHKRHFFLVI